MFSYPIDSVSAFPGSPTARYNLNKAAILIAKSLDGQIPTAEQSAVLSQYSGWGDTQVRKLGFDWYGEPLDQELKAVLTADEKTAIRKSALNAHYTGLDVVRAMWGMAERVLSVAPTNNRNVSHRRFEVTDPDLDAPDGTKLHLPDRGGWFERVGQYWEPILPTTQRWILEPSCGSGVFFGTIPPSLQSAKLIGVELDPLTAQICQALYPEADIHNRGFETCSYPLNSFDLIIGNVPFGNYPIHDPTVKWAFLKSSIHDYFIAKSIMLLKPLGCTVLITSRYTLDKKESAAREWLSRNAELLAAIRLPETAFQESAGTDVVTDILVLRKRPQPIGEPESWVGTVEKVAKENGVEVGRAQVSVYYDQHPEHLLGSYCRGKMQHGFSFSVKPRAEGTLAEQLAEVTDGLKGAGAGHITEAPSDLSEPAANPAITLARRVFDRAKEQLKLQAQGEPTESARRRLNSAYDGYRARFGSFTSVSKTHPLWPACNEGWFSFLQALEDERGNKAKLFFEDTISAAPKLEGALKLADAVHVCLDQLGSLDLEQLAKLTGLTTVETEEGLAKDALAFKDPSTQKLIPAPEYLSGPVREKLQAAKAAALIDQSFERNVTSLEAAQPEPLGPSEIRANFGACWIPTEIYAQFLKQLFLNVHWGIKVSYIEPTSSFTVDINNPTAINSAENLTIYGTARLTAIDLIELGINLKIPTVYDEIENPDGTTARIRNEKETVAAQGKLLEIKARWDSWVFGDEVRAQKLCEIYNQKFNGFRLRQYSGEYLSFPGLALSVDGKPYVLRRHQRSGVARILSRSQYDNSAFPVYPPGYGKTDTAVCGIVKATQLGLVKKTCIVVPKHTLGQWRTRFLKLYPGMSDELLAAGDDSFSGSNRRQFLSRVCTGGYRYVLLTFEQFRTIPLSQETFGKYLKAEIEALADYLNDCIEKSVEARALQKEFKKREKALAKFEVKYKKQWDKLSNDGKEAPITWEECGFDCVVGDECQGFKRDVVYSRQENISGLPRGESQRAFDNRVKIHYVLNNGGKAIGLTGTPLTNTLAEAYVWMRCYQPQLLKHLGLWHFDAWASLFTEPFTSIEMDSVGKFRQQTRLRFQNIPELLTLLAECWDRAPEAPEVNKPGVVGGQIRVVEVAGSEGLIEYTKELADRADLIRARKVDPKDDNMLCVTSDGRKASIFNGDPTLGFVDGIRTKVDALCDEVWRYYRESYSEQGTQLIFCDLYTPKELEQEDQTQDDLLTDAERLAKTGVYGVIKNRLVERGILANEIEFAHDVRTEEDRAEQFERTRRGRCRVLIGSTGKLGTGVNVQDQIYALHHLDCPWRPDELEQRTARAVRDGNRWPAVHVVCYVTQRSYDPVVWQLIEHKSRLVAQVMTGKLTSRQADDIGALVLTASMAKAIAMGDSRIVDKIRLEMELATLERQWKAWHDTKLQLRYEARNLPEQIEAERLKIEAHQKTAEIVAGYKGRFECSLREIGGSGLIKMGSPQEASEQVRKLANLVGRTVRTRALEVGRLQGMMLYFEQWHGSLALTTATGLRVTGLSFQNARSVDQMLAELNSVETLIRRAEHQIKLHQSRMETAERELSKRWSREGEAKEKLDAYKLLCQTISQNGMVDEQSYGFRWE